MRVEVKFVCAEALGQPRSGAYDVPDSSTISDVLSLCLAGSGDSISESALKYLLFLRNGKPAPLCTKLAPGDRIHVLRKIVGG